MTSNVDINAALANALGVNVSDGQCVQSVVLRIVAGEVPEITVTRVVLPEKSGAVADAISTVRSVFKLEPVVQPQMVDLTSIGDHVRKHLLAKEA